MSSRQASADNLQLVMNALTDVRVQLAGISATATTTQEKVDEMKNQVDDLRNHVRGSAERQGISERLVTVETKLVEIASQPGRRIQTIGVWISAMGVLVALAVAIAGRMGGWR